MGPSVGAEEDIFRVGQYYRIWEGESGGDLPGGVAVCHRRAVAVV